MTRVYDDTIVVDYNQAYVHAGGMWPGPDDAFVDQSNGLCGAATRGTLLLMTASMDGPIRFIVEVLGHEPPLADGYDDIVEVSFEPQQRLASITGLMGGPGGCEFELPEQRYRVRYSAKNLDAALKAEQEAESDEDSRLDQYLLQFWPWAPESESVVKQSSAWALYRHESVDGTAELRETEAALAPNQMRSASPRTRHEALVWLVRQAGVKTGISEDPLFVGAIADSWQVLEEFLTSGYEAGDFYFLPNPPPSWRRGLDSLWPALERADDDVAMIPNESLLSSPIWHRLKAWAALRALLESPFHRLDDDMSGPPAVVGHARHALQEDWPEVEIKFAEKLESPSGS